jgi:methylated-DNA-[protein]-cysteine S-methyltransferase
MMQTIEEFCEEMVEAPQGAPFPGLRLVTDARGAVCAVDFIGYESRLERLFARRFGAHRRVASQQPTGAARALGRYLAGDVTAVDALAVRTGGTEFQTRAWLALREIGAGRTATYAEQARRIGAPRAVRAVGAANGRNPIAIVLPCHRVVGGDGKLTGYAGGLPTKAWLLALEGARVSGQESLGLA